VVGGQLLVLRRHPRHVSRVKPVKLKQLITDH
jgi:hypothetical protein